MVEHYVYRIKNLLNEKHYYGVRTCKYKIAEDDLGIFYFSSSTVVKSEIKKYGIKNFKFIVVRKFLTRIEAEEFEIFLHNKFKVARNDKFYNKARHTKRGFAYPHGMSSEAIIKRKNTLLAKNPNAYKDIGKKSSIKQKENYRNGCRKPNTNLNKINFYDVDDNFQFFTYRINFTQTCQNLDLPERVFLKSLMEKGWPLYIYSPPQKGNEYFYKYKGWYCLYENEVRMNAEEYKVLGWFKNSFDQSYKSKTYEERYGIEKTRQIKEKRKATFLRKRSK